MDIRPVLYIIGVLLTTLSLSMMIPMLVDLYYGNPDWKIFFYCVLTTAFFGGTMVLSNSTEQMKINTRQGFLMMTMSWVALSLFSALPFWFSNMEMSFTDAVFESISGLTTTGSTVISGLDTAPPGILIWRAILQWLGGVGIILMALSILPFLKVGGMQLFETELSEREKALPRMASLTTAICAIYLVLTVACAFCYQLAGMTVFDSFCHAMTTIATGGFANYDASFGHFDNHAIEMIATLFMIIGGIPFILFLKAIRGNPGALFHDSQVRWFLSIVGAAAALMTLWLGFRLSYGFESSLITAAFNVVSAITGTGYVSEDFQLWGGFASSTFFFLMVVGGCAGSTSCGIKIFRFQVLYAVTDMQIKKLLHPHGMFIPHYGKKPIPEGVPTSVMSFFFLFALCFAVLAMALSFTGLDFITSMSGAATAIANYGPGLGDIIGPAGNFKPLPDSSKWILCAGMLFGRLEIFTILVLFSPNFWRR